MAKLSFIMIFFFAVFVSCEQKKANMTIDTISTTQSYLDTNTIAILPADKSSTGFLKDVNFIQLTNEELSKLDQLLKVCINTHNAKQDTTKEFSEFIDLKKYKRQYVAYIDKSGEKKVYINCFCISNWSFEDWKETLVQVDDGGSCFFHLTINLTKLKYEQFATNGYG